MVPFAQRVLRPSIKSSSLLLAAFALCACRPEEPAPSADLEPLPPRFLEPVDARTKQPTAELLTQQEKLAAHDFSTGLGDWKPINAETRPLQEGGVILSPIKDQPFGIELTGLDWDASAVHLVGLVASSYELGHVRLHFAGPKDDPGRYPTGRAILEQIGPTKKPRPYGFVTSNSAPWVGKITRIAFKFEPNLGRVHLESVHAVSQVLIPGASPTVDGNRITDAGLIELSRVSEQPMDVRYQSRRATPAIDGEFAVALFEARRGERLTFSYALPIHERHLNKPSRFQLFATPAQGRKPKSSQKPLFEERLTPGRDGGRWHSAEVTLPDTEGEQYELWLRVTSNKKSDSGRLAGLWGPLIARAPEAPPKTSVLVITADTLRADHVGYLRELRGLPPLPGLQTPNLDALFARGVAFPDTLSTCNSTSPSHVSIFTSLHLKDHGVITNDLVLPESHLTLGEILAESGRFGLGSVTARHLNSSLSGLGQGMHAYLESPAVRHIKEREPVASAAELPAPNPERVLYATGAYQAPALLAVLDELDGAPFFAWHHCFDAHTPYRPRPEVLEQLSLPADEGERALLAQLADEYFKGTGLPRPADDGAALTEFLFSTPALFFLGDVRSEEYARALYAAGVSQLDRDLGKLFSELETRGRLDNTLIVFTADHGESLGERGVWFGHEGVYDNTLHVPLAFAGPGVPSGLVSNAPASTVDLVPTVCDLLGLAPPEVTAGVSLVERFSEAEPNDRRRWFEYASRFAVGFRDAEEHVLLNAADHKRGTLGQSVARGTLERYAPGDAGTYNGPNLAGDETESDGAHTTKLREWMSTPLVELGSASRANLTGADEKVLELLGYTRKE